MHIHCIDKIKILLTDGDARTKKLKSNIILSILLKGVSVVVTFLLVPATIDYVDSEVYGVWLTLAAVLLWFQILDIGLAPGLKNKLTEALAVEDFKRARALVSTAYLAIGMIFVPLSVVLYFLVPAVPWSLLLNVDAAYEQSIVGTMRMLSVMICVQMVANVIVSVLAAYQRVAFSQSFLVIGNIFAYILIFLLSKAVPASLPLLAIVLAGSPILVTIIGSVILYHGFCRDVRPAWSYTDMSLAKELLSLGSKFFIINVQAVVVYQSTNLLISYVSSPEMVTAYNIAYKYLSLTILVYANVTISLWTSYTDAYAKGDRAWMVSMRRKMNRLLLMCVMLCFVFAAVAQPVYSFWIGDKVEVPAMMTWSVAAYVASYCFMTLNGTFIISTGKVLIEVIVVSIGAVVYIPVALYAAHYFGQYGILAALVVINVAYGIIFYVQTNKLLSGTARGIWNR